MTNPLTSSTDPHEQFVANVQTTLVRQLRARHRLNSHDAQDAAAAAVVRLLPNVVTVVESYPSAQAYAGAVACSAAEDHRRAQRAQRGEGARLVPDGDDPTQQRVKRTGVALNSAVLRHADRLDVEGSVVAHFGVEALLSPLAPVDRWLVRAIIIDGYRITEVARELGYTREYVSRRYNRLRAQLREHHTHLQAAA